MLSIGVDGLDVHMPHKLVEKVELLVAFRSEIQSSLADSEFGMRGGANEGWQTDKVKQGRSRLVVLCATGFPQYSTVI